MASNPDPIDKAIRDLWDRRVFLHGEKELVIACLIRTSDWRPLRANWWQGKEVCVIGADLDGNFFLRHSDGTVRYWDHKEQTDQVLASSVRDFLQSLA
jgi:hypothetical protein